MDSVVYLVLRRMRAPLLLLIFVYAVAIGGLVLIPGTDSEGRPWRFDFLHAFYFISYTASTIGFGEIPYAFSPAQRLWVSFTIYLTVIGWLYAFGGILALLQDAGFKRALARQGFARKLRRNHDNFYLICGFGETGAMTARLLANYRLKAVALDENPAVISTLALDSELGNLPALVADARDPAELIFAGLRHPHCLGVIALTGSDDVNVDVALAAMLLNRRSEIICRADTAIARGKLPSSHTVTLVDPFETFGAALAQALHQPHTARLHAVLRSLPGQPLPKYLQPPHGHWLICGYGRFGRAVERYLKGEGITVSIIEANPRQAPPHAVIGGATQAGTLQEAGINHAAGIVVGTGSDISNLATALISRELVPNIFTAVRQNQDLNHQLFDAAPVDLTMETSRLVVNRIFAELTIPLLREFLARADTQPDRWAALVVDKLSTLNKGTTPHTWVVEINETQSPALVNALGSEQSVTLEHLYCHPQRRTEYLPVLVLLSLCNGEAVLLPPPTHLLRVGERLLFAGDACSAREMEWVLGSEQVLTFVRDGTTLPAGSVFRWWTQRRLG